MKKAAVILLSLLLICAVLVSCGNKDDATSGETSDGPHYSDGNESGGDITENSGTDSSESTENGSKDTPGSKKDDTDSGDDGNGSSLDEKDIYEDPSSWTKPF